MYICGLIPRNFGISGNRASQFRFVVVGVFSSFAIILHRNRELVAFLLLLCGCDCVSFTLVSYVGLWSMVVAFAGQTYLFVFQE